MRRVTYLRSTIALGVVVAAVLVTSQQACTPSRRPGPVAFTVPSAGRVPAGDRQTVIRPSPSGEPVVFVLTRVGDKHQLRTAGADPLCLEIERGGAAEVATCDDSRAGQFFTLTAR